MNKSSVHGLLKTLKHHRAIEQSEKRRYILGPRIFDLAQAYGHGPNLRRSALPSMRRLAASTGQAVFWGGWSKIAFAFSNLSKMMASGKL